MKKSLSLALLAALAALSPAALSGPINKQTVGADAKWLLHIDVDNLRSTKLGQFLMKDIIDAKLHSAKQEGKFSFSIPWEQIHSITGYGTDYQNEPDRKGVLLLDCGAELHQVITGLLIQQQANPESGVRKIEAKGYELYSIKDEVSVALVPNGPILVSKVPERIEEARRVGRGEAPSLAAGSRLTDFPKPENTFFFLALAEGFNEQTAIPPQAQILKQANGARLILGENSENLFLNLVLLTKNAEATSQIQQVLQGMLALVSLSQTDNPELASLAQSTKITGQTNAVAIDLKFPVGKAIEKISAQQDHKKHPKSAAETPADEPKPASEKAGAK